MTYSDLYLKKKHGVPTILGLFVVLAVTFVTSKFLLSSPNTSRADPKIVNTLKVTNLNSSGVTILWTSETESMGWVIYGQSSGTLDNTAFDDRDVGESKMSYLTHHVTLKNLDADKTYYFKIIQDNKIFGNLNDDPFAVKTLAPIKQVSNTKPAYGRVADQKGSPVEGAIVILNAKSIYPRSTVTKTGGDFVIPLNQTVDQKTKQFKALSEEDELNIEILKNKNKIGVVTNISHVSPLPETLILDKNYNFLNQESVLSVSSNNPNNDSTLQITYPQNNAIIVTKRPLIKGGAPADSNLQITLQGEDYSTSAFIKSDSKGLWKLDLKENLLPGKYTLTASNGLGGTLFQTRQFTIAKSGERVLAEATGSASPTVTPAATLAPTTAVPTQPATPSPTTSITSTPSQIPSPLITQPPTTPSPPVSGQNTLTYMISGLSMVLIGIGIMMFAF